jgi:hypothetical protein
MSSRYRRPLRIVPALFVALLVPPCCLATEAKTVLLRGEVIDVDTRAPLP